MADALFASVNGLRIKNCYLVIPAKGRWTAEITIDQAAPAPQLKASLSIAGMTLAGTVTRSGDFLGSGQLSVIAGANGWSKTIPSKPYRIDRGVQLGTVVFDAATECGERVNILSNRTLGQAWVRQPGTASLTLKLLADSWWLGPDGVTQIGPRPTPTIKSAFDVLPEGTSFAKGIVQIATDTPADWQPGAFFSAPTLPGQLQAKAVIHNLTSNKLRTEVWI